MKSHHRGQSPEQKQPTTADTTQTTPNMPAEVGLGVIRVDGFAEAARSKDPGKELVPLTSE
jgi:hypothetical protein